ncbi:Protein SET DOMAIN GROUP 41 [Rhynchospora pubera]|uniref:Protein SET DOMAIN GROUP 41 n=1 Tax=Rhynchospora pubera TaxID=906938 RepID=A0AAV8D5E8_9POAL|nr:Protein SET DOMAIN GROUP 41 [Rhynchospora pubera]
MVMEMAMRARDDIDIPMSHDLTPPIPPLAASLHSSFLASHCSSCFHPLQSNPNCSLSCPNCTGSVNYCSPVCLASDSAPHTSSGECQYFLKMKNLQSDSDHLIHDSTDLRVALRLLHFCQRNGLVQFSDRLGGLLVGDLEEVLGEGGELAERIKDDALLMSSIRSDQQQPVRGAQLEMMVLLAVLRNSVEVQVGEGWSIGVAVYGPHFSWFNHSCSPNAFYRFQLYECGASCESTGFLVVPSPMGETTNMIEGSDKRESTTTQEHCVFSPRVVLRSIKPINKGEEVCITYTDLLQPKCDSRTLNSRNSIITSTGKVSGYKQLSDAVQEAIEEYASFDNPKLCCDKLETILSQNSFMNSLHVSELAEDQFSVHPLHHLSLMAYTTLASAYKWRSQISDNKQSFNLSRISVAYFTLLCLSTYRLFLWEPSLMASTSHFLLSAGEAMLDLLGNNKLEHFILSNSQFHVSVDSLPWVEFQSTNIHFVKCVSELLLQCWPFLVQNSLYLENVKSPIDFSCDDFENNQLGVSLIKQECFVCESKLEKFDKEQECLCKLAVHCLMHGMYLASICYGSNCHLADKAKDLLNC